MSKMFHQSCKNNDFGRMNNDDDGFKSYKTISIKMLT